VGEKQLHTHIERTPTGGHQNRPSWAGGSVPLRHDEDDPTVTAVAAIEPNGTNEILDK
jgi:hypothetical protein